MKTLGLIFLMSCVFFMGYYAGRTDGLYDGIKKMETCQKNKAVGYIIENNELECIF